MDPAQSIISKLGGPSKVAAIVGVHRTRVSNWSRPSSKGGTGGVIPQRHHRVLLEHANAVGVFLTAEDFLVPSATAQVSISASPEVSV